MGLKKGQTNNPNGRPRDPIVAEMREALRTVEKKKRKSLLVHFFEKAFKNDKVLVAAAKKIAPDLEHTTADVFLEPFRMIIERAKNAKG